VGFQIQSKPVWLNSWIAQIVRQRIPDCRTNRNEGATTEGDAVDSQLMAAGRSQVPATGNIGHWNAVVGEVSTSVLHSGDTGERLRQTCTALAEGRRASDNSG